MHRLVAAVMAILATATTAKSETAPVARAIDGFIRPAYASFAEATGTLNTAVAALCDTPSSEALGVARDGFRDAVATWSEIEIVRFGPVMQENRLERILFWPDRKSIGLKQVQAALAAQDATATDAISLAGKSVAMQGLGALEFVLFGTDSDTLSTTGGYRCAYGRAIASNVSGMAAAIARDWSRPDGFAYLLANPAPDNPVVRTDAEAVTEIFDVLVQGLEFVRDVRINGFFGASATTDKPKQAVFWRSEMTVPSIRANLAGIARLLAATDLKPSLPADQVWVLESIIIQLDNADETLVPLAGPIDKLLAESATRDAIAHVVLITSSLSELFGVRLAGAPGLSAGFSSLDGD